MSEMKYLVLVLVLVASVLATCTKFVLLPGLHRPDPATGAYYARPEPPSA